MFDSEDGLRQEGEGVVLELEAELVGVGGGEGGDGDGQDMNEIEGERGAGSEMRTHEDERTSGAVWSYGIGLTQQAVEDVADMTGVLEVQRSDGDVREQ